MRARARRKKRKGKRASRRGRRKRRWAGSAGEWSTGFRHGANRPACRLCVSQARSNPWPALPYRLAPPLPPPHTNSAQPGPAPRTPPRPTPAQNHTSRININATVFIIMVSVPGSRIRDTRSPRPILVAGEEGPLDDENEIDINAECSANASVVSACPPTTLTRASTAILLTRVHTYTALLMRVCTYAAHCRPHFTASCLGVRLALSPLITFISPSAISR